MVFFFLFDFLIVLVLVLVLFLFVCLFYVSSLQKSITLKFHSIFHPLSGSKETIYNSMRKPS